ncbi:hypothetical protein MBLNU457_5179t2 [Dothideomycetes sp. NU457]
MNYNIPQQRTQIETRLKTLTNPVLKDILGYYNQNKTGVKATLQARLIFLVNEAVQNNNLKQFEDLRYMITNGGRPPPAPSNALASSSNSTPVPPSPHGHMPPTGYANRPSLAPLGGQRNYGQTTHLSFKPSAFYHVEQAITPVTDLPEMPSNRHTVNHPLTLSPVVVDQLKSNTNLRIMLYCATSTLMTNYERVDVAFPNQLEVRVNQEEIKANFKGLKNKPGTTKPTDITDFVRRLAGYQNQLQITYALTSKKFSFVVNLVRKSSAEELTERIRKGKIIRKGHVLDEMRKQAQDSDIVVESTVISLKDPISTLRISLPCRSTEQAPTWTCPICNKSISYEALVVDEYFQDILQKTDRSVNKVTIEPDGEWRKIVEGEENKSGPKGRATYDNDSDDDLVEIPSEEPRVAQIKNEPQSATPGFAQHTPPLSSREPSISNASATRPGYGQTSGFKRPSSAVVDLTLSDDDDEPPRPAKRNFPARPTAYNTPTSMSEPRASEISNQHQNQNMHQNQSTPRFGSVSQPNNPYSRVQLPRPNIEWSQSGYGQPSNTPNNNLNNGHRLPFPSGGQTYPFGGGNYAGSNRTFNGGHSPT